MILIGFALSLLLPAPDFVTGMGENAWIVWLVRIGWVVGLPLAFGLVLVIVARVGKWQKRRDDFRQRQSRMRPPE